MIIYASEERLMEMAEKTSKMMVFGLEKGKKYKTLSEALEIEIPAVELLPNPDIMQSIANGDLGTKEVVKKVIKMLKNPDKVKNTDYPVSMHMLLSVIIRNTKNGIMTCFVEPDTGDNKKLKKFCRTYISEVFGVFGYDVIMPEVDKKDKKFVKELFKGKKKKVKERIKDEVRETAMDSDGAERYNEIRKAFELELMSASFDKHIDEKGFSLKKKNIKTLKKSLVKSLTKKSKISKKYRAYYEELADLDVFDLPKVKKIEKIKAGLIPIIVRHLASRRLGLDFGSKEYYKEMMPLLKAFGIDEKAFKEAVNGSTK